MEEGNDKVRKSVEIAISQIDTLENISMYLGMTTSSFIAICLQNGEQRLKNNIIKKDCVNKIRLKKPKYKNETKKISFVVTIDIWNYIINKCKEYRVSRKTMIYTLINSELQYINSSFLIKNFESTSWKDAYSNQLTASDEKCDVRIQCSKNIYVEFLEMSERTGIPISSLISYFTIVGYLHHDKLISEKDDKQKKGN